MKNEKKEAPLWPLLLAAVFLIVGGAMIFLYPTIANYIAEKKQAAAIQVYNQYKDTIEYDSMQDEWDRARKYNDSISGKPSLLPFALDNAAYIIPDAYTEVLNLTGDGMMGYLDIPKIDIHMPIYHSCDEQVLQNAVGHVEQTHLPIGGRGNHAVLSGHRGLRTAELFTRLDELEIGDKFSLHILDATMTYEVDEINVVLPDDLKKIDPVSDEDLVTLVTCTPYGVNTHRLLVRGHRIENVQEETQSSDNIHLVVHGINENMRKIGIAFGIVLVLVIGYILFGGKRKKEGKYGRK